MRVLRPLGLLVGLLTALGVLVARALAGRYVRTLEPSLPGPAVGPALAPSTTPRERVLRRVLGAVGVAVLLLGLWKLLHAVQPGQYGWLLVWLLGAVLLHDLLIAPVLVALRAAAHRGFVRLPALALVVVEGAFLVVGLLVLVVVPQLWAQHLGPANPTVLPGPYGRRLALTAATAAVACLAVIALAVLRSRRTTRPRRPL